MMSLLFDEVLMKFIKNLTEQKIQEQATISMTTML